MAKQLSVLVAHDDSQAQEQFRSLFQKIHPEIEILQSFDLNAAFDELCIQPHDLLVVEYGRPTCDGKRLLEQIEDIKPSDRPRAAIAVANVIDRGFLNADIENLTFVKKGYTPIEFISAASTLLGVAPKKTLDSGFIFPFLEATCDVLRVTAQTDSKKRAIKFERNEVIKDISAVLTIASPQFYGSLAVSFEKATFLGIVSRMLGEEFKEITHDIKDAASEICNQIFGQAKRKLNDQGHELQMAIPQVVVGQQAPHTVDGQCLSVQFETEFGLFIVETMIR